MQGRLSQKENLPLQSFPHKSWRQEFVRANKIGFKRLEWLIDIENDYKNPIFSSSYREEILWIAKENGIKIDSLCAHFLISGGILKNLVIQKMLRSIFMKYLNLLP